MSVEQTGQFLGGLCKSAVYQLIADKKLRAKKIGGKTVVLVKDAESFLAALPDKNPSMVHAELAHRRWAKRVATAAGQAQV